MLAGRAPELGPGPGIDAASAVPASDRLGVYEVYVARPTKLYGLLKARDVYRQAIVGGGLPDEGARAMCVGFTDVEIGLGEVTRARVLYTYAAAFTDPEVCPEFWKWWNDFEVLHGDEGTFREMLRVEGRWRPLPETEQGRGVRSAPKPTWWSRGCARAPANVSTVLSNASGYV